MFLEASVLRNCFPEVAKRDVKEHRHYIAYDGNWHILFVKLASPFLLLDPTEGAQFVTDAAQNLYNYTKVTTQLHW